MVISKDGLYLKMLSVYCIVSLFLMRPSVDGYQVDDVNKLLEDKLATYNKDVRPLKNQSNALNLKLEMELLSIVDFDEVNQKLQIAAVIKQYWSDELMTWNPNEYGGLGYFSVNSRHFWTPPLVLVNSVDNFKKLGEPWLNINFRSSGEAVFYPGEVLSASCNADVTYFPWDIHRCYFSFMAWGAQSSEIFLKSASNKVLTNYFSINGGWSFEDSKVQVISRDRSWEMFLSVSIDIRRKSRFVIVNMVAPIIFLSALNLLTFLIPSDSGERISYSITVLLALAVFLTIVGDNLPRISHPMALFGYYLLGILFLSGFIIITTLVSLNMYHKDEKENINRFWMTFAHLFSRKVKSSSKIKPTESVENDTMNDNKDPTSVRKEIEGKWEELSTESYQNMPYTITWKEISGLFDKVCFVVFTMTLTISTIVFFSVIYTAAG